jgi:hypothetical protein
LQKLNIWVTWESGLIRRVKVNHQFRGPSGREFESHSHQNTVLFALLGSSCTWLRSRTATTRVFGRDGA